MRLTQREFAALVGSNEHEVRGLVRDQVLPELQGRGRYDETHVRAYVDHLRVTLPKLAPTPELAGIQVEIQRQKLRAIERDNRVKDKQYAPISLLESYAEKIGAVIHSHHDALAGQLKRRIPHLRKSELDIVRDELRKASAAIAEFRVDD